MLGSRFFRGDFNPIRSALVGLVILAISLSCNSGFAATQVPQSAQLSKSKPVVVFPKVETGASQAFNLLGTESRINIEDKAPEPFSVKTPTHKTGPQIMAVTDASSDKAPQEAYMSSMPEMIDVSLNRNAPEPKLSMGQVSAAPGVSPIQAITLNEQGQPVRVIPKAAPIGTINIGQPQNVYSALSHVETESPVDKLLMTAMSAYRQKRYLEAEASIQKALQMEPNNDELLAALGEIQVKQDRLQEATDAYRRASEKKPGEYERRYAQLLLKAGKRQDALAVLEQALILNPKDAKAVYMLGTLHEEAGRHQIAISYLQQAAELLPKSADIRYNLGVAYELLGNSTKANAEYQKALALNPQATDIRAAISRTKQ